MRERLLRDRPAKNDLDVKLVRGGMMDIEFLAQIIQLIRSDHDWPGRSVQTVLTLAEEYGDLSASERNALSETYKLCRGLQMYQRAALESASAETGWPAALRRITSKALNSRDFEALISRLRGLQDTVWSIFCKKLQPETTEWGQASR